MKIVYIAHPIGGDVEANLADLRRIIRKINMQPGAGVVPFVPYYADVVSLDDSNPDERARGMENGRRVISSGIVDEMWLTGPRISPGMEQERDLAERLGIRVVDFTGLL
jgi:hypothetical protein